MVISTQSWACIGYYNALSSGDDFVANSDVSYAFLFEY
jgi:hypothetical protein